MELIVYTLQVYLRRFGEVVLIYLLPMIPYLILNLFGSGFLIEVLSSLGVSSWRPFFRIMVPYNLIAVPLSYYFELYALSAVVAYVMGAMRDEEIPFKTALVEAGPMKPLKLVFRLAPLLVLMIVMNLILARYSGSRHLHKDVTLVLNLIHAIGSAAIDTAVIFFGVWLLDPRERTFRKIYGGRKLRSLSLVFFFVAGIKLVFFFFGQSLYSDNISRQEVMLTYLFLMVASMFVNPIPIIAGVAAYLQPSVRQEDGI